MTKQELLMLPACKERAVVANSVYYFTGKNCVRGHQSPRYTSSGNCVQCIAEKRNQPQIKSRGIPRSSAENVARAAAALSAGSTAYIPDKPCKHGHKNRCVTTHNCITCWEDAFKNNKEKLRWQRIERIYGMSKEQFIALLEHQSGRCPICSAEVSERKSHIDHCHVTGKVRGILCSRCNQAIGLFNEDENSMMKAVEYLRNSK